MSGMCWGGPFSPSKFSFTFNGLDLHLIHGSLGPLDSAFQMAFRSLQLFLHSLQQSVPILYNRLPLPFKIAPLHGNLDPRVPWAHPSSYPKWHLISSAIFAELMIVTDRPTDHTTPSVTTGRGLRIMHTFTHSPRYELRRL